MRREVLVPRHRPIADTIDGEPIPHVLAPQDIVGDRGAPKMMIPTAPMSVIVLFRTTLLVHANAMPLPKADRISLFSTTGFVHRETPPSSDSNSWIVAQLRDSTALMSRITSPDPKPPARTSAWPCAGPWLG